LDSTISSLMANHVMRTKNDPDYQYFMAGIQDDEQIRAQTSLSLNLATRKAQRAEEIERRLARENVRRAALHLEPISTLEELEAVEEPDVPLDQAAAIISDLAQLRENQSHPEHTAQLQ
jgi:carboxyl-terminal processing protease